jgi:hypothetical protein
LQASIGIATQTVVQYVFLAESTQRDAGIAEETDAADAAVQIGNLARRLVVDQLAGKHLHRLRHQRQRRIGARADSGGFGLVERLRSPDHLDRVEGDNVGIGGSLGTIGRLGTCIGQRQYERDRQ